MAQQDLATDMARRRKQRTPLGDREPGTAGERDRRLPIGISDRVDEPKDTGETPRDPALHVEQITVEPHEGSAITGTQRGRDLAVECAGEGPGPGRPPGCAGPVGAEQALEHRTVRRLGADGAGDDRTGERTVDELADHVVVETGELGVHRCAAAGGDRRRRHDAGEVVEQLCSRLGDTLVGERQHQRPGARRPGAHVCAEPHPLRTPPPQGAQVVVERRSEAARRADDEFDAAVEVAVDQDLEDVGEFGRRLPGQLVGERDDGTVAAV